MRQNLTYEKRFSFIGFRLKQLRGEQSQSDFAQLIGVPFRTYQRYEAGETAPKRDVIEKISKLTGKSVDWIMTGESGLPADHATEQTAANGHDDITRKLVDILKDMDRDCRRDVLKYAQEKKQAAAWRREKKLKEG